MYKPLDDIPTWKELCIFITGFHGRIFLLVDVFKEKMPYYHEISKIDILNMEYKHVDSLINCYLDSQGHLIIGDTFTNR